jgi:large subunit ribosomal protein L18
MDRLTYKKRRRFRIRKGIRKKISGTPEKPRMSVFRSNREIYVQLIDDANGITKLSVSSRDAEVVKADAGKLEKAEKVGAALAKKALEEKIETVVFDRNGYLYHGRVKALADAARENGLKF